MGELPRARKPGPEASSRKRPNRRTLDRFARVIGEGPALRLSAHFGGRQLYVPHVPRAGSELAQVIGDVAAKALGKRFGGMFCAIPIMAGRRARMVPRVVELRQQRKTVRAIASELACTERHVYNVLAEFRASGGTLLDPATDDPDLPSQES